MRRFITDPSLSSSEDTRLSRARLCVQFLGAAGYGSGGVEGLDLTGDGVAVYEVFESEQLVVCSVVGTADPTYVFSSLAGGRAVQDTLATTVARLCRLACARPECSMPWPRKCCAGCRCRPRARYCSEDCHLADWRRHRSECRDPALPSRAELLRRVMMSDDFDADVHSAYF